MRKNARCTIGLLAALSISALAEVVLLDEDFSSASLAKSGNLLRDSTGWVVRTVSNWELAGEALTGTGQAAAGEGACAHIIPVAGLGLSSENSLTLSFDYATTNEGETVYVHIWGCKENGTPSSATTATMNTGASNGNVWDQSNAPFDMYNLGKDNSAFTGTTGIASDAAVSGLTGSGSYTNTFDLSTFTTAPSSLDQYDYIAIGLTRNQANASGLTSFDNIKLTAEKVAVVASAVVIPEELVMDMVSPATVATGAVDFVYNSDTNLEVTITVSDQSHPGAFVALDITPLTLTNPVTSLQFEIDNARAGLANGESATGLVTFAWTELGSAANGQIIMPISSMYGFAPGQTNLFTGAVDSEWDNAANWDLARVPGALGADLAMIDSASVVNVSSNYSGIYAWETVVKGGALLNIAADLIGGADTMVGSDGDYGFVYQTAGDNEVETLTVGDAAALSNSVYTLSGGTLTTLGELVINSGGVMKVTGGSMEVATAVSSTARGVALASGGVLEISGGTYQDTSRIWGESGCTVRIIGDAADITVHQLFGRYYGSFDFILNETGVSTLKNNSWGSLGTVTFNIDGAAYTGGPKDIVLYSGGSNNGSLGSDYAVTNLGVEGVDWEIIETTNTPHTITLKILGSGYATWASGYGLTDADAAEDFDYDGDLFDNLTEYALGGNPTNDADRGYVPTYGIAGEYFEYVYARRLGDSNLVYTAEFGTDLVNTNWDSSVVSELPITGSLTNDFESVTNRVDMTGKDVGFMQLLIESL
ncbi:hypothetical protein PDESU_01051 [Pontiella desulfatans]|uniref:Uncharacterized protein n=1 Tax=Pontiella desulfatans TaxID=2750659 RepID=A0A6C2TXP8_PONDE|nr:hypothetical protein [Pontiella desulfatans]VGO12498.1 hypothetical protein PDESU_01051 [Pontiella desulfatans]